MIDLMREPVGMKYEKLITYALQKCDAFSVVFCDHAFEAYYRQRMESLRAAMAGHLIKTRNNPKWPGTVSYDTRHTYIIDVYRASQSLLDFLLAPQRLFAWCWPEYPEDIAFFQKGKCWLSTCAHEKIALIATHTKEDEALIRSLGLTYSVHPDCDPFFEDYSNPDQECDIKLK